MALLILGLLIWSGAHLLKRVAPGARAKLTELVGQGPAKGGIALLLVVALALMVAGFRRMPFEPVYDPPGWGIHLNNLMMLGAVALLGMGHSRGRARSWLRNPMLTGVAVWALAHLLVNGDVASLVLFGGLLLWALAEIALIGLREPHWERPPPGPASGDLRLALITIVVYAVIGLLHGWLGPWPFPG